MVLERPALGPRKKKPEQVHSCSPEKPVRHPRAASGEETAKGTLQRWLLPDFSLNALKLLTKHCVSSWPPVCMCPGRNATSLPQDSDGRSPTPMHSPTTHGRIRHTSTRAPREQKPSSRTRSKGIQSKSRQSNFWLVSKRTNATGQAGKGCCPRREPSSHSRVSPGRSPRRTLKRKLTPPDHPRGSHGCRRGWDADEKMSSSSWVTQTLHKGGKLRYCQ